MNSKDYNKEIDDHIKHLVNCKHECTHDIGLHTKASQ